MSCGAGCPCYSGSNPSATCTLFPPAIAPRTHPSMRWCTVFASVSSRDRQMSATRCCRALAPNSCAACSIWCIKSAGLAMTRRIRARIQKQRKVRSFPFAIRDRDSKRQHESSSPALLSFPIDALLRSPSRLARDRIAILFLSLNFLAPNNTRKLKILKQINSEWNCEMARRRVNKDAHMLRQQGRKASVRADSYPLKLLVSNPNPDDAPNAGAAPPNPPNPDDGCAAAAPNPLAP